MYGLQQKLYLWEKLRRIFNLEQFSETESVYHHWIGGKK